MEDNRANDEYRDCRGEGAIVTVELSLPADRVDGLLPTVQYTHSPSTEQEDEHWSRWKLLD